MERDRCRGGTVGIGALSGGKEVLCERCQAMAIGPHSLRSRFGSPPGENHWLNSPHERVVRSNKNAPALLICGGSLVDWDRVEVAFLGG